jgi:hypothetical protein
VLHRFGKRWHANCSAAARYAYETTILHNGSATYGLSPIEEMGGWIVAPLLFFWHDPVWNADLVRKRDVLVRITHAGMQYKSACSLTSAAALARITTKMKPSRPLSAISTKS